MKKPFKDPIAPRIKTAQNGPWSSAAPSKDVCTSGELSVGNNYGTGFKCPVGSKKTGSYSDGPIPLKSKCFSPKEIFYGEDERG